MTGNPLDVSVNLQPVLSAVDLCKSYFRGTTETKILTDVSLDVYEKECLFLHGPSGSGKSTLLSIMGCVLTADSGSLVVAGQTIHGLRSGELARIRRDCIGFIFQRFHLVRGLTATENVCVPMVMRGTPRSVAVPRAKKLLESLGLGAQTGRLPSQLSVGQCQRVSIARALANDPKIILADEPTASLDGASGSETMRLLRRIAHEESRAVVVVTHDHRIEHFADRILYVDNGRISRIKSERGS